MSCVGIRVRVALIVATAVTIATAGSALDAGTPPPCDVFFSTTFSGSGFGGRLLQLDPATSVVSQRTDFWFYGTNTELTLLRASADRSTIGIVAGDISSGPVFKYSAATDVFSKEKDLNTFVDDVALDATGTTLVVDPGTFVLDSTLSLAGTIVGGGRGVAVDRAGTIGYRVRDGKIDVLDLTTFLA